MFKKRNEQMALALALSNYGAERIGDAALTPVDAWVGMLRGLMECGHGESEAEMLIEREMLDWLHSLELGDSYALKEGGLLLERFAWGE